GELDSAASWRKKAWNNMNILGLTIVGAGIMFAITLTTPSILSYTYLQFTMIYSLLNIIYVSGIIKSLVEYWFEPADSPEKPVLRKELKHNAFEFIGGFSLLLGILIDFGFLNWLIPGISTVPAFLNITIIPGILLAEIAIPTMLIICGISFAYWNETQRGKSEQATEQNTSNKFTQYSLYFGLGLLVFSIVFFALLFPQV